MKKKLLSPKSDFIFKKIFGDHHNTDILAAFLQTVLDLPEDEYEQLVIVDPHLKKESSGDKMGILDVKIHTKSGSIINVEIQVSSVPQMRERIAFYTAKMITEQIGDGEEYDVIKRVISIIISDYRMIQENEQYHNRYRLYDPNTCSQFSDILEVNVLELPKLPSVNDNTELWDWMKFIKFEREEDLSMLAKKNPKIKKTVGILMELSQDERARLLYEEREKARRDDMARYRGAKQEGLEKGLVEGLEKGLEKGLVEGLEKGREERQIEIARNALKKKLSVEDIAEITGLTHQDIEKLRDES